MGELGTTSRRDVHACTTRVLTWSAATVVLGAFAWLMSGVLADGLPGISAEFLIADPRDAGRAGGIGSILLGTAWVVGLGLLVSAPLALLAAVWMAEFAQPSRALKASRASLEVLAGVPSIVIGLFGNALFCRTLGLGFSVLSGALTLALMVMPILIRTTEEALRAQPRELRASAFALGITRTTLLRHVLLPAAAPGLVVGAALGLGRAIGESAALIFTSGYVDRAPGSVHDSARTLAVHIYDLELNIPGGSAAAQASALVLIVLVLAIGLGTSFAAERWRRAKLREAQ